MKWFDIPDELLPPVFRRIKDMYAYGRTLDTELREFLVYAKRILSNFFVQTCDLQTIEYWEQLLNIHLYGDETIEERRQNILLYLNNSSPTTEPYVRRVLTRLFGAENYDLSFDLENNKPYDVKLEIRDTDIESINKFMFWFTRMCPAHLVLNAIHTETSEEHNGIYLGAQSDYMSYAVLEEPPSPPEPEYIDILLGLSMSGGVPRTVSGFYSKGSWYNSGILSIEDKARLNEFGIQDVNTDSNYPYGKVGWNNNYTYEPLAIYKDAAGEQLITENMSHWNFHCNRYVSGGQADECIIVCGASFGFYPECKTWKCRITKIS